MLKMDGLTISVKYSEGKLSAETRGMELKAKM